MPFLKGVRGEVSKSKEGQELGKMAQWLKAPAAFLEDLGLVSGTDIRWLTLCVGPVLVDPGLSSGLPGYCTHAVLIPTPK